MYVLHFFKQQILNFKQEVLVEIRRFYVLYIICLLLQNKQINNFYTLNSYIIIRYLKIYCEMGLQTKAGLSLYQIFQDEKIDFWSLKLLNLVDIIFSKQVQFISVQISLLQEINNQISQVMIDYQFAQFNKRGQIAKDIFWILKSIYQYLKLKFKNQVKKVKLFTSTAFSTRKKQTNDLELNFVVVGIRYNLGSIF
eukprot:TRINITY_DN7423_c0_g1_i1.p3 TRINITY_DN7423_c0_g1~~TRINITY_DN7423_c0_g1_i1.p3  ORF type:complete len:196 (-),score=-7.85 TRINITY_DN7423_c0_g1_i1:78-665(-)